MDKRYYIAYGSNLNVYQMRYRCPNARIIGTAVMPNYELLFKGSKTGSYLTIEPKDGSSVPVAVWETTAEDEFALDRYEGYPAFYYKKELVLPIKGIKTGKVRNRKVYVYIMHEERPIGIPSKSYVRTCIEGYHNFGFDIDVIKKAYERSRKECLNESDKKYINRQSLKRRLFSLCKGGDTCGTKRQKTETVSFKGAGRQSR